MKSLHKKMSEEDKFARKYYCNSYRFVSKMKKQARKKFRKNFTKKVDKD